MTQCFPRSFDPGNGRTLGKWCGSASPYHKRGNKRLAAFSNGGATDACQFDYYCVFFLGRPSHVTLSKVAKKTGRLTSTIPGGLRMVEAAVIPVNSRFCPRSRNGQLFMPPDAHKPGSFPRAHGPWRIESSRVAYSDPWVNVRRDEVTRPDGLPGSYAVISVKSGVCVVAIDDQDIVHLTKEFHFAVGRVTIEGVSGGIEEGHSAEEMAHRELEEELGIRASDLVSLGMVDPFTASVVSPTALFLATGLTFGAAKPEATELIEHVMLSLEDAIAAVFDGTITHSPTCVSLLKIALMQHRSAGC